MIVSIYSTSDMENTALVSMIENAIENGKCIEIYMKNEEMLYVKKNGEKDYTYGFYAHSSENDEWKCNRVTTDSYNMMIKFEYVNYYREIREFIISDCTKLYIGDDWSN